MRDNSACGIASVTCTIIWIAGAPRLAFKTPHSPARSGIRAEDSNITIGKYLTTMGAPRELVALQLNADPCCLNFLDQARAKQLVLAGTVPTSAPTKVQTNPSHCGSIRPGIRYEDLLSPTPRPRFFGPHPDFKIAERIFSTRKFMLFVHKAGRQEYAHD